MSDYQQLAKVITSWKIHEKKKIIDVLKRVDNLNLNKDDIYESINKTILAFHKQIQNAQRQLIDNQWFANVIKIKKKLKKISETKTKQTEEKPPSLKKIQSNVEIPDILFQGIRQSQNNIIKVIWKNFAAYLSEQQIKDSRTIAFVQQVIIQLRKIFDDELDTKKQKRIDSICMHLGKQASTMAKVQMIQGKKTAKQVAEDYDGAYRDAETEKRHLELMKQQFEMSQTGFYDNMKKTIFSGAAQQCRYCKKPAAYCDDMKQIRASDEPMTRFMKCNNCNKNWRD